MLEPLLERSCLMRCPRFFTPPALKNERLSSEGLLLPTR